MDLNAPHDQLSLVLFKGNIIKEARVSFTVIRVLYFGLLLIIIACIIISIILSTVNPNPEYDSQGLGGFFLGGFASTAVIVGALIGIKAGIAFSTTPPGKTKTALFVQRAFLGVFLLAPAAIGLYISTKGEVWWVVLPFFINSGLALWWKFPTRKRWEKWASKLEPRPY